MGQSGSQATAERQRLPAVVDDDEVARRRLYFLVGVSGPEINLMTGLAKQAAHILHGRRALGAKQDTGRSSCSHAKVPSRTSHYTPRKPAR
jgi:hypothetical protein